ESNVKGITGRRISIESASKIWNACGLRIGGLLTDNQEFHDSAVSEYTANLCANTLGQEIFGVLSSEPHKKILEWQNSQKNYYKLISNQLKLKLQDCIPGLIVTIPEAAIYFVIDFRNIIENFDTTDFINYCALKGRVEIKGEYYTLLLAPMSGFYDNSKKGKTQVRVAMVETLELMELAPKILKKLFYRYKSLS
ncbi:MAG: aminotransferase class I/II, partial [Candidatus Marinimicrobia bacterium]|nr:aminotransferase class I/II [Candidatus Neomarinimicrobiota bacterium]